MRFAVVGAGVIGALHARTIAHLDGASLGAVVDVEPDRAAGLAGEYQARALGDLDHALALPDIDAVAICTPSGNHADLAEAALRAGKHVVVEKPLDVSLEAGRRVARAERESGRTVAVISQHRFDPSSLLVDQAIRDGRLGRVTSGSATISWWRSQGYYDSAGWRGTWALDGGGALMNQGIHTIDLLVWFLGRPVEVFAWTGCLAHDRIEVEDTAVATIRFESGALGVIQGTTAAYPGLNARVQVHGDRGSAVIDDDRLTYFHAAAPGDAGPDVGAGSPDNQADDLLAASVADASASAAAAGPRVAGITATSHTAQYQDFLDAVRHGKAPLVSVEEALRTLAVVRAIYASAEQGRPVAVDDVADVADGAGLAR